MNASTNGAMRRNTIRQARTAILAGTAAAALTAGLAAAPSANAAIPVNVDLDPVYTAGTLASLLNYVGNAFPGRTFGGLYNSGPPQSLGTSLWFPYTVKLPEPINKDLTLTLDVKAALFPQNLKNPTTKSLYNTLAAIPQQNTGCGGKTLDPNAKPANAVVDSNPASTCRFAVMIGTSGATRSLANAYSAEIASVQDPTNTPAGYLDFEAAPGSTEKRPTETNQLLAFLQNPLRPNGGLLSRFPTLSKAIGQNPEMPAAGLFKSADGTVTLNTTTLDATWAYDPTADFPEVFNMFSIINSLNALLPINLTGGLSTTQPFVLANSTGGVAAAQDVGQSLASLFQVAVSPVPIPNGLPYNLSELQTFYLPMADGQAYYATIVPKQLPFYSLLRLPATAINAALARIGEGFRVGTPIMNALEPATKIMVNIGYDDVVAPDKLDTVDPNSTSGQTYAQEGYQAYDRTFLKAGVTTPFGSVDPLTKEQRKQVPGDVFKALGAGFKEMFSTPAFGFIVPAPAPASKSAAATPSAGAVAARVAAPAAVTAAPVVNPATSVDQTGASSARKQAAASPGGKHRASR
jgi:hypothetical protein